MKYTLLIAAVALTSAASAQSIDRPAVQEGDTWVYRSTTEKGPTGWNQWREEVAVTRVTASTIFFTVKPSGSTQAPKEVFLGNDWSRARDVNGKETVVNRPLLFPLSPGKSWDVVYTEQNPNKNHRWEKLDTKYTVVGWEPIDVPAGKFRALKVESEGRWQAELAPGQSVIQGAQANDSGTTMITEVQKTQSKEASGRTYKAFWYVPEVKRWVKSVEEYYSSGGVRSERYTQELESFNASGKSRD